MACDDQNSARITGIAGVIAELELFARAKPPRDSPGSSVRHVNFMAYVPVLHLLARALPSIGGYYACLARVGGEGRVRILLNIARAAHDGSRVEETAQRLVNLCSTSMHTSSLFPILVLATTHGLVIGDPFPWYPSDETIEFMGVRNAEIVLWVAYTIVVVINSLCLVAIMLSVSIPYILEYMVQTPQDRITLLCEMNPAQVVFSVIIFVGASVQLLLTLGGILASPKWGLRTTKTKDWAS